MKFSGNGLRANRRLSASKTCAYALKRIMASPSPIAAYINGCNGSAGVIKKTLILPASQNTNPLGFPMCLDTWKKDTVRNIFCLQIKPGFIVPNAMLGAGQKKECPAKYHVLVAGRKNITGSVPSACQTTVGKCRG